MGKFILKNRVQKILSNSKNHTSQKATKNKHTFQNISNETNLQSLKIHTGLWGIIEITLQTQEPASRTALTKMCQHTLSKEKILLEKYFSTLGISIFLGMEDLLIVEKSRGHTLLDS